MIQKNDYWESWVIDYFLKTEFSTWIFDIIKILNLSNKAFVVN